MTIITAIHDAEKNITWLGSNSRATIGSFVAPAIDKKWFVMNGWVLGVTGSGPKLEALQAAADDFPKDATKPFELLKFLKTAFETFDIGEIEEGLKRYCGGGLLAHQSGAIWDFDNSFCMMEVPPGRFWARGSGMDVAIGAAIALGPHVSSVEEITRRSLEITIDVDVDCPGEPLIQTFDVNGVLSGPKIA